MGQESKLTQAGRNGVNNVETLLDMSWQFVANDTWSVADSVRKVGAGVRDTFYASKDVLVNSVEFSVNRLDITAPEGFNLGGSALLLGKGATGMVNGIGTIAGSVFAGEKSFATSLTEGAKGFAMGVGQTISGAALAAFCVATVPASLAVAGALAVPAVGGVVLGAASYVLNSDSLNHDGKPARVPQERQGLLSSVGELVWERLIKTPLFACAAVAQTGIAATLAATGVVLAPVAGAVLAAGKVTDFVLGNEDKSPSLSAVERAKNSVFGNESKNKLFDKATEILVINEKRGKQIRELHDIIDNFPVVAGASKSEADAEIAKKLSEKMAEFSGVPVQDTPIVLPGQVPTVFAEKKNPKEMAAEFVAKENVKDKGLGL